MAMLTLSNGTVEKGLRDPSFSSYLTEAEQNFVLNLAKQCKADDYVDDGEIGVFSADKYFNEKLDEENPKVCEKAVKVEPLVDSSIKLFQSMNESSALSVRSGSSANSQSTLLQRAIQGPRTVNGASKVRRRGYLGSFRCKCVCSDKNSVAVEEYESSSDSLNSVQRATKETMKKGFSNPVTLEKLSVYDQGLKRETCLISKHLSAEDLPRKSLEVFGLPVLERRNKTLLSPFSFEMEKKLRLNWEDELPKPAETVITAMGHGDYAESDSDASSDLFEIEDFTSKLNPFLSRQASRNMSGSATPTAGYAPSEASIAWSVVTASAADFPITSEYEELQSGKNSKTGSTMMTKKVTEPSDKPRLSSSFLACNSQEAVTVVDRAHKTNEKIADHKYLKSHDSETQVIKPKTEATQTRFEPARNTQIGISSRSVAVSNSIHGANMLYFK